MYNNNRFSRIPDEVMYDARISPGAKLLYVDMANMSKESGVCWATRGDLARKHNTSERTIRRWINELEENNYISKNENNTLNVVSTSKISRLICDEKRRQKKLDERTKMSADTMTNMSDERTNMSEGRTKMSTRADKIDRMGGQKCPLERTKMSAIKENKRKYKIYIKRRVLKGKLCILRCAYVVVNMARFVDAFNNRASRNKIIKMTVDRRVKLLKIQLRFTGKQINDALNKFFESDFLQGKGQSGWIATVDWLLKPENFVKVLEGTYDTHFKAAPLSCGAMKPTEDVDEIEQLFKAMYITGKDDNHV